MIPVLVTPPVGLPVTAADLKRHLRVDHDDDDASIDALQAAAVAYLDGYHGILGRCILPQTWSIDVTGPGPHRLPFPDASNVTASGDLDVDLVSGVMGSSVAIAAAADQQVTVTATYGLPAERLPSAVQLIKMLVAAWYEYREAVTAGGLDALPMGADSLIRVLQWRAG